MFLCFDWHLLAEGRVHNHFTLVSQSFLTKPVPHRSFCMHLCILYVNAAQKELLLAV